MHFICRKDLLIDIISTVSRAMATRSMLNVLEGIFIQAMETELLLKCTDGTLEIECRMEAQIMEQGTYVVPGRLFSEIIRRLPEGELAIKGVEHTVHIDSGQFSTTLACYPPDEFPSMPALAGADTLYIRKDMLRDMIRQSIFAASIDMTKPILCGALLQCQGGEDVKMVALDGYRMALRSERFKKQMPDVRAVLPSKSLQEIMRTLDESEDEVGITVTSTHALIEIGQTHIKTALLEGEYIQYERIIPTEHQSRVLISRHQLLDAMERASLLAREGKNNLVKFSISEDTLLIVSRGEMGNAHEELPVQLIGKEIEIAFNARYFTDVLKNLDDEEIYLEFNTNVSPCLIRPVQGEAFIYLVLPVRIAA